MKKKHLPHALLWLLCLSLSAGCNKEVDVAPIPPFSVFPNPFLGHLQVYLDQNIPAGEPLVFRILDGRDRAIAQVQNPDPGSALVFDLSAWEKAVYYVELRAGNQVFITPIVKAE